MPRPAKSSLSCLFGDCMDPGSLSLSLKDTWDADPDPCCQKKKVPENNFWAIFLSLNIFPVKENLFRPKFFIERKMGENTQISGGVKICRHNCKLCTLYIYTRM